MKSVTMVELGDIADLVDYGVTAAAADKPIGPKFLRITDIQNDRVDWESVPWCEETASRDGSRLVPGDIVFARTGATTGKSFLVRECPTDSVFASYLIRVRMGEKASPEFIAHFFRSPLYWQQILRDRRGVAQPGVNATKLKKLQIPLPSLPEQKRIAAILDAADDLRMKRRESLELLDRLVQSVFLDIFGDPVTNPNGWKSKALRELGDVQTGKTPPSNEDGMFGGEIPFVTPGALGNGWAEADRTVTASGAEHARTVERGATFVCCIGATIGKVGKAAKRSAFNQQINAVTWGAQILPEFGHQLMRRLGSVIANQGASTTLPILNKGRFEQLHLPVPPVEQQEQYSDFVKSTELQRDRLSAHLAELDRLFASLQSRAFRGEI